LPITLTPKDFFQLILKKSVEQIAKLTIYVQLQKEYKEEINLPVSTAKYYVDCVTYKEDPLIFYGVPHLLLKGYLDISLAKTIKYKPF
jgi:hypothetical protein